METKKVTIIDAAETGRYSFWEMMLLNKFGNYHYEHQIQDEYEVVKETEKAYQIRVPARSIYRFIRGGDDTVDYTGDDWNVWMPKKAFVAE